MNVATEAQWRDGFGRPREDQMPQGGYRTENTMNVKGKCVRHLLLLREMPFWRHWGVSGLAIREYESGMLTAVEEPYRER